jgi:uncharacterized protein
LLIVAPTERKVRIEVGYGLEGTLTDTLSKTIIEQEITPRFKKGDMGGGIVAGTDAVLAVLGGEYTEPARAIPRDQPPIDPLSLAILSFLLALFIGAVLSNAVNLTLAAAIPSAAATALGAFLVTDLILAWLVFGVLGFLFIRFLVPHSHKLGGGSDDRLMSTGGFHGGVGGGFGGGASVAGVGVLAAAEPRGAGDMGFLTDKE